MVGNNVILGHISPKMLNLGTRNAATGGVLYLEISQNYCSLIKKETAVQVFSSEFCEIFMSTFSGQFTKHIRETASV